MQGRIRRGSWPKYNPPQSNSSDYRGICMLKIRDTPERGGRSLSRVRNPELSGFSLLEERRNNGRM